jgi:hypothetical protein
MAEQLTADPAYPTDPMADQLAAELREELAAAEFASLGGRLGTEADISTVNTGPTASTSRNEVTRKDTVIGGVSIAEQELTQRALIMFKLLLAEHEESTVEQYAVDESEAATAAAEFTVPVDLGTTIPSRNPQYETMIRKRKNERLRTLTERSPWKP